MLTLEQKKQIAELMWFFDAYGMPDIMEEEIYSDLFDDAEDIITDLTEFYIGGELTEANDPGWLDLINGIRAIERS